ncbi:MAG: phosphoribosyltransferase [Pigmentiphaga sp.]
MESPESASRDLWVSWAEYHELIEQLALQVHASGWRFDQILCLARGGMRVGDVLSRIFEVPLAVLAASSYREAAGTRRGALDIASFITLTHGELGGRVLLVDDMIDTGTTFRGVLRHLRDHYPQVTELRSAVLWWKGHAVIQPDFHAQYLPSNPWIHQPFEVYDSLRPQQLQARLSDESP